MGNYHVRFCNGGGAGDRSTDRSAADTLRSLRSLRVRLNRRPLGGTVAVGVPEAT